MAKSVSHELSKHFDHGPQVVVFRFFLIWHLFLIGELIMEFSLWESFWKFIFIIFTGIGFQNTKKCEWHILSGTRVLKNNLNITWYDEKSKCKYDFDFQEIHQH